MSLPIEGVERIAVLRPNAVGDFVFSLPALAALRAAYPRAHIALLGKRWHREFLAGRPGPADEVIELPPLPGLGAPAGATEDEARTEAFIAEMRLRRFDLAIQLYGGGRHANPFIRRLGARVAVGMRAADAPALDRNLDYRPWHNERLRLLEVVALAGAPPAMLAPPLALIERDAAELRATLPLPAGPLVVLQPGATDPRRRWPARHFAAVGDALAAEGAAIAINGSTEEAPLVAEVAEAMRAPVLQPASVLSLSALAALLGRATLVVSNDTGPLHLAQALGTHTVGIYWFMNLLVSAPLVAARHRHAFSARTVCPVCGLDNVASRCLHDDSFVADVSVAEVLSLARAGFSEAGAARAARAPC